MIIHLIDVNGHHRFTGDPSKPKVKRKIDALKVQGFVQVPKAPPDNGIRQKWTGTDWVDDPVVLTEAEVDAKMDAHMDNPATLSILEAIADRLPGPVSVDDLKADARARGRVNMPR